MVETTASDAGPAGAAHAGRAADGRSPVALRAAAGQRRLRAGDAGRRPTAWREPRFARRPVAARARRLLAHHRRRPRGVHPLRPLHPRLRRGQAEHRHRPERQAATRRGIALRPNLPMGSSTCVSCGECMVSCPTGALTNKRVVDADLPHGDDMLDPEWMLQLPVFKRVSGTFLELNQGAVVRRRVQARRGHLPRRGVRLDRVLHPRAARSRSPSPRRSRTSSRRTPARAGWSPGLLQQAGRAGEEHSRAEESGAPRHPDRRPRRPAATTTRRPARARRPVRRDDVHELPSALGDRAGAIEESVSRDAAQRARHPAEEQDVPAELDRKYRAARARDPPAQRAGARVDAAASFIDYLRDRVELVRFSPGEVIVPAGRRGRRVLPGPPRVREGQRAPSRAATSCSRTSAAAATSARSGLLGGGVRTATCTALDHVDVVRIAGEDFHADAVASSPTSAPASSTVRAASAPTMNRQRRPLDRARRRSTIPEPGADGGAEPAGPRPREVHALRRVRAGLRRRARRRHAAGPRGAALRQVPGGHLVPLRAATRSAWSAARSARSAAANSLEIIIEDWCIGCGLCASNCPYGNINMHPFAVDGPRSRTQPGERKVAGTRQKATTCDLCMEHARAELRLRLPARRPQRVEPRSSSGSRSDARSPAMLIDRTPPRLDRRPSSSSRCSSPPRSTSPTRGPALHGPTRRQRARARPTASSASRS